METAGRTFSFSLQDVFAAFTGDFLGNPCRRPFKGGSCPGMERTVFGVAAGKAFGLGRLHCSHSRLSLRVHQGLASYQYRTLRSGPWTGSCEESTSAFVHIVQARSVPAIRGVSSAVSLGADGLSWLGAGRKPLYSGETCPFRIVRGGLRLRRGCTSSSGDGLGIS